jgi:ribonucleotide monophosphatase NagD (HAD superfamily)
MERKIKIAVDLDGTISEYPQFFTLLTKAMSQAGCKIYVVTDRPPETEEQVSEQLQSYGITYDIIKITSQKSRYILKEGITVLFDDVDEYFLDLPAEVAVFKIRQKYNFDFAEKKWI